jgi:hypothetical protein
MDPIQRAALAESLAGNMAVHIVYCTRRSDPTPRADPAALDSVPVCRELTGEMMARGIQADGTVVIAFDGLRIPVALPPLAGAILRLVDGRRSVGEIGAVLAERGIAADAFRRAWLATFQALERVNRLLLAAPRSG